MQNSGGTRTSADYTKQGELPLPMGGNDCMRITENFDPDKYRIETIAIPGTNQRMEVLVPKDLDVRDEFGSIIQHGGVY